MDRTSPTHGRHWTISAEQHEAEIVQCGAALQSYRVDGRALADHFRDDELPVGYAGQLLAPWPNRVAAGAYTWRGEHLQLPLNEPARGHAIHGLLCWEPWTLLDRAADRLLLERNLFPRPGYPFALTVTVEWSVSTDGLRCRAVGTNPGTASAPFGFGSHPYLRVPGTTDTDDLRLQLPAATRLRPDERLLPVAHDPVERTGHDFRAGATLAGRRLDDAFTDVAREPDGTAHARLFGPSGDGVEIWADGAFGYWQVFTADSLPESSGHRRAAVAIEPMTCPADAFNSGEGLVTLDPGARWEGTWGIRPC
ncbi:MAG TPA: aldose 1-epimerase family protein [Actinomycetes bacterium]